MGPHHHLRHFTQMDTDRLQSSLVSIRWERVAFFFLFCSPNFACVLRIDRRYLAFRQNNEDSMQRKQL